MTFIKGLEDGGKNSAVFSTTGTYGDSFTRSWEQSVCGDGIMDFVFKDAEEAGTAELVAVLRADNQCSFSLAVEARC